MSSIEVSPNERTMGVLGTQVRVSASALNAEGERLYGAVSDPGRFSWSSSEPDIATVAREPHPRIEGRKTHLVTSVSEGTATISASSQGVTGSMVVTVRDRARSAWSAPIPGGIGMGNVMGADGTIHVGTNEWGAVRSRWFAVSPQGAVLWSLELPAYVRSAPAFGEDGTLYLASWVSGERARLIAVDPGGSIRWMLEDLDPMRASPAIGPDGTIYAAGRHHVYAVDPQGEIQWSHEQESDGTVFFVSSPGIASDGTLYVGGEDGLLYAIDPEGSLLWTFRTGDRIRSSPSIGVDGTIYFGSHDGRLYAVNPDGEERWSVHLDGRGVQSSPSIGPDGTVYVIADGVVAVDPGGSIRWRSPAGGGSSATPILGADGTVYVAGVGPRSRGIFALDSQGALLWDYSTANAGGSPLITLDGAIIFAAGDELVAVVEHEVANGGFEGAPWPTERGDRANTGRAGG